MPTTVTKIGLLALGAIGDLLLSVGSAVPQIRRRYPGAKIILFTSSSNRSATTLLPSVDELEILEVASLRSAVKTLNRCQPDVLVDFGPWPRISAIQAALTRGAHLVGFATPGQHRHFAYDVAVAHDGRVHEWQNYISLMAAIGVDGLEPPKVRIDANARVQARARMQRPYVVCHPWAAGYRKEMREWPEDHWRRLATEILNRGFDVAFTGGPSDRSDAAALFDHPAMRDNRIHNLAGELSLQGTAALLEGAATAICVNTGVMHIAAALDVPMLALHGPTNPQRWGPLSRHAQVLMPAPPDVAYLNLGFDYPPGVSPCMHRLSVSEVLNAFDDLSRVEPYKNLHVTEEGRI